MAVRHGIYVGPIPHLRGEGALIQTKHPYNKRMRKGRVFAQFDTIGVYRHPKKYVRVGWCLSYGWHEFAENDFKIRPEYKWPDENSARADIIRQIREESQQGESRRVAAILRGEEIKDE